MPSGQIGWLLYGFGWIWSRCGHELRLSRLNLRVDTQVAVSLVRLLRSSPFRFGKLPLRVAACWGGYGEALVTLNSEYLQINTNLTNKAYL
jgi:hypothetical protein